MWLQLVQIAWKVNMEWAELFYLIFEKCHIVWNVSNGLQQVQIAWKVNMEWAELFYLIFEKCHIVWNVSNGLIFNEGMQKRFRLLRSTDRMTKNSCITHFDYTLQILRNFVWENKMCQIILIELHSSFLRPNCFLKVLENWPSVVKMCHVGNVMYQNV